MQILAFSSQFVHLQICTNQKVYLYATIVYASPSYQISKSLWNKLIALKNLVGSNPWCLEGNFNAH